MSDREIMEYDIIIVGAGPSGLACAIRLKQLQPELMVAVIEKGAEVGAHILSGAVIEPGPLDDLIPGWRDNPPPIRDRFVSRHSKLEGLRHAIAAAQLRFGCRL